MGKAVAVDSSVGHASKPETSVDSSGGDAAPVMLLAASPDDTGAASDAASPVSKASGDTSETSGVQTAAKEKLAWCHREYVSEKDCDSWVADQMARREARRADEKKRREERRENEEARRHGAGMVMLPALEQRYASVFLIAAVAGASLIGLAAHASIQQRWYRNRSQVALLDDVAQV